MIRFLLAVFLLFPLISFAEVVVPEFSFVGKEISKYEIKSSFSNINIEFSANTGFDTYLSKVSLEFKDIEKSEYEGKDPGFMYSGKFGTGLSAVFVGEKAYRNFILKHFISKDYLAIIEVYNEYKGKMKNADYIAEVDFLYALSLMETGGFSESENLLKTIALGESIFAEYATDKLMSYYFKVRNDSKLLAFSSQIEVLTPHPLYLTLYVYLNNRNYDVINKLLKEYDFFKDKYVFLYDFDIISKYYSGDFEAVTKMAQFASKDTEFFVIDSYLMLEDSFAASKLISKIESEQMKAYFSTKSAILENEIEMATLYLERVTDELNKLNLFFYYLSIAFPDLNVSFIDMFELSPVNMDYINFYKGIFLLKNKRYVESVIPLEKVSFKTELLKQSHFYKGVAYLHFNRDRSSYFMVKYINEGDDPEKVTMSRFMLAQLNYLDGKYDEAMIVLSGCSTSYCRELKAEIYIKQRKYLSALKTLKSLKTDKAKYLSAVCYFNQKRLAPSAKNILAMKKQTIDSQLLLMNIYFKTGKYKKGNSIYLTNKDDERFIDSAIKHLFLVGRYKEVLSLINSIDNLTDEQLLIKAKTFYSLGKYKESEYLFTGFIDQRKFLYDSIYGLISINQVSASNDDFIKKSLPLINKYKFDKKDFLIIQLARLALEKGEINSGMKLLNQFFSNYKKSPYTTDAYIVKAGLFMKLGRYNECIMDMDSVLKKYEKNEDALFQKAECLEHTDKGKAVDTYLQLSTNSERFRSVSYIKVILLTDSIDDLIKAAAYFKKVDTVQYLTASEKLLGKLGDKDDIFMYDEMVYNLLDSNDERFVPAGLYYSGVMQFENKAYKQTARYALKGYYLFKESKYSVSSLKLAKKSYLELNDNESLVKIEKLIKNNNKKVKK